MKIGRLLLIAALPAMLVACGGGDKPEEAGDKAPETRAKTGQTSPLHPFRPLHRLPI